MNYAEILNDLIKRTFEASWFEFKENWFNADKLGEYISALSNTARIIGSDYAYFFWGINDKTHAICGTSFNYNMDVNHEPLEHYLLRNLYPSLSFKFDEFVVDGKRIVILIIPPANNVPTSYKQIRYIRRSAKEPPYFLRLCPRRFLRAGLINQYTRFNPMGADYVTFI